MPLSLTKIAFGCESLDVLAGRLADRIDAGQEVHLTTRYLPKRHAEMAGGSLYWIIRHTIVARSPLIGFEPAADSRHQIIRLEGQLIAVRPRPKRAHQGWRYLEADNAPADIAANAEIAALPPGLASELEALALL